MKWTVTTAPSSSPVTVNEVATHCRLEEGYDSAYLQGLIDAATEHSQEAMGCSLMARTITAIFYDGEKINLPHGPLISISSITADGDTNEISDYDITRHGKTDVITINESVTYPVTVVYRAGYSSASAIPADIRLAIRQHVATLYEHRESISDLSLTPVPHSLESFYRLKRRGMGIG